MNNQETLGYSESPKNGTGIIRARTTGQLRIWRIPKTQRAIETLHKEFGEQEFPGVYILFEKRKVYVGEAKSIYNRLNQHFQTPDEKIKGWDRAIIINDGRIATQSDFNDTVVRKALEYHLNKLLKANKYTVVSQASPQVANPSQQPIINILQGETDHVLIKQNVIEKLLAEKGQEEVHLNELKKILEAKGYEIEESKWGAYEAVVNKKTIYIRPGSKKPRGWQVTFRDRFKKALEDATGSLLMPRDGVILVPFSEIKKAIPDSSAFKQNTVDVFIEFKSDGKVFLKYKKSEIDITSFKILS